MKVIGISGSPRKDGNTEILVKEALKPFYEKGWEVLLVQGVVSVNQIR